MELEEIYDIIGANYPYTFDTFLDELTPLTASRLIELIDIREHNYLCKNAILNGHDVSKLMVMRPRKTKRATEKQIAATDRAVEELIRSKADVK